MSWEPIDLSADEHAKPSEPPVVLDLVYREKRHALSGPPESAKTLLACVIGLEWYRAGLGRFALVDFEQSTSASRLLMEDLGATSEEIANVYYIQPDAPPKQDDFDAILAAGVTLFIIDAAAGAYDASGLDDNGRKDAEQFRRAWIDPLWRAGCTTILLDHVVKNTEARGRYAIGSERKLGQVDVHLGLEAITQLSRGGHGLIKVTVHKDRPAHLHRPHPCDLHLDSDPDTHRITWERREPTNDATESDLPPAARKLLEALSAQDDPASGPQLVDWIAKTYGHGLKRETVSRQLNQLARDGLVDCANPDAPTGTARLWLLRVTEATVTRDHHERVTGVTDLLEEVTRSHHTANGNDAPASSMPLFDDGSTTSTQGDGGLA